VDEAEREALLRERIKVMDPSRFEQLVYELAHREDEGVERVQNPDGGADTILPRGDGLAERVWQAKRFPSQTVEAMREIACGLDNPMEAPARDLRLPSGPL
jgi:restriction endonuclease Mrr